MLSPWWHSWSEGCRIPSYNQLHTMVYGTLCHSNRIPPSVLNLKERKALGEKECWRLQNTDDIPDPLKNRLTNRQTGTADNVYANHEYLLANTERESSRIQIDRISTLWLYVGFKCLTKTLLQLTHHRWKDPIAQKPDKLLKKPSKSFKMAITVARGTVPRYRYWFCHWRKSL